MGGGDKKRWRDFAHTVLVLSARARNAQRESGRSSPRGEHTQLPASRRFVRRFECNLLAAATSGFTLPKAEVLAEGGGLGITIDDRDNEIRVTLQLKGFAALTGYAGREARLVSADGAIDYAFRFSEGGTGLCVLANAPAVHTALSSLSVLVAED